MNKNIKIYVLIVIFLSISVSIDSLMTTFYLISLGIVFNQSATQNYEVKTSIKNFILPVLSIGIIHFMLVFIVDKILELHINYTYLVISYVSVVVFLILIIIIILKKYNRLQSFNRILLPICLILSIILIFKTNLNLHHIMMFTIIFMDFINYVILIFIRFINKEKDMEKN